MSRARKFWITSQAASVLIGALIVVLPSFTDAPDWLAMFGIVPLILCSITFGLWTFAGEGM